MEQDILKTHFQLLSHKETLAYHKVTHPSAQHTLILLHGQATSSNLFEEVLSLLQKESDFSLYSVDMRGFGESSLVTPLSSLGDLADDIYLFIKELGLQNVTLAGLSTGGGVGLVFAGRYPGFLKGLVLLSSVGARGFLATKEEVDAAGNKITSMITKCEDLLKGQWAFTAEKFMQKDEAFCSNFYNMFGYNVGRPSPPEKLKRILEGSFQQRHFSQIMWLIQSLNITNEDNGVTKGTGEISKINTPTLIIHGENDLMIPLAEAKHTYQLLGEKITKMEILPNCGHISTYTECENVCKLMVKFIRGGPEYNL